MKNKILIIGMSNHRAGIETFLYSYTSRFEHTSIDFLAFHDHIVFEEDLKSKGYNILKVTSRKENYRKHYKELKEIIKNNNYDAVWMHSVNVSYILPIKLAYRYNVPTRIIHAHNSQLMGSKITKFLHHAHRNTIYKYTTDFWTCSMDSGKWMFPKVNTDKITMVKNAIDLNEFRYDPIIKEELKQKLGLEDKKIIGTVGRLTYVKNHTRLLSIFKKAIEKNDKLHLIIVGEGPERENLESYINSNNLEQSVTLLGSIDYIPQILSVMDLFVLPSLFEGLPIVLVEAQATGLKCIVSTTVDNEDVRITNLLEFISLEENDECWAQSILENIEYDRENKTEIVRNAGFDIETESQNLEKWFLNKKNI